MAIIGIDLGTTNSLVAYYKDGKSILIPNEFGEYLTPSVVHVTKEKEIIVGKIAKELLITEPKNTASVFKRSMGLNKKISLRGIQYTPEELSAFVIKKLVEDAKRELQEEIEEVIVSVPAYFDDVRRKATKRAGELAGVKVERLINEPSAAALACRMEEGDEDSIYMVFDFGGGTLDISIVECFDNVISINAVSGDNHLGGSDFDQVIAEYICEQLGCKMVDLSGEEQALIRKNAEQLKKKLSTESEVEIYIQSKVLNGKVTLDHDKLVEISSEIFSKIKKPIRKVLNDSDFGVDDIDKIVLVGGSSKMAVVSMYLYYLLGKDFFMAGDSDETVARGLGYYAGMKGRAEELKEQVLTDVCPFSLGTGVHNDGDPYNPYFSPIIERNSVLPVSRKEIYVTAHNLQTEIYFSVYQGDEIYANDNVLLEKMVIMVPPKPKGEEKIEVRYTYDINGILDVDVFVPSIKKHYRKTVVNKELNLSKQSIKEQLKQMEKLKVDPREQEENRYVIHLANSLYQQTSKNTRTLVEYLIQYFDKVLSSGDEYKIKRVRKQLLQKLNKIENQLFKFSWEEEDEEEWLSFDEETEEETEG